MHVSFPAVIILIIFILEINKNTQKSCDRIFCFFLNGNRSGKRCGGTKNEIENFVMLTLFLENLFLLIHSKSNYHCVTLYTKLVVQYK